MEALFQAAHAPRRRFAQTVRATALLGAALLYLSWAYAVPAPPVAGAQPGDSLYVYSGLDYKVLRYDGTSGAFQNVVVDYGLPPNPVESWSSVGQFNLAVGPDGSLYVFDFAQSGVMRYDGATGNRIGTFIDLAAQNFAGYFGIGMAFGPDQNLYLAHYSDRFEVLRFDGRTGAFLGVFISDPAYPGPGLISPFSIRGVTFGPDGRLYISTDGDEVWRFDGATGALIDIFVPTASGGLDAPRDMAFGPDGDFYVLSFETNQVLRYDGRTGAFLGIAADAVGSYPAPNDPRGRTGKPGGLAFGPDGNLYVSNAYGNEVRRYDGRTGAFLGSFIAGGTLRGPVSIVFGPAQAPAQDVDIKPARVTIVQRPQHERSGGVDMIVNTLVAVNRGKGSAANAFLSLPYDPRKLELLDVRFSRPGAWVSALRADAIEMQTGRLGGAGQSNLPTLQSSFVQIEPLSGPAGDPRTARSAIFAPGEPVSLWYNTPSGQAVAIGQVSADPGGAIQVALSTAGMPAGDYSLVAYGQWTEFTAVARFEVR